MAPPSTPGRTTRSRAATPLPALQTRQSHAYGAQGKAALYGQVTQSQDAIDQAFTMTQEPVREPAPAMRKRGRKGKAQLLVDEDVAADLEEMVTSNLSQPPHEATETTSINGDEGRPGTALQDSAAYQDPPPPPPPPPRRSPAQHSVRLIHKAQHEPSYLLLFWRTLRAWLPSGSLLLFITMICTIFLGIVFFFGTIAAWAPLPQSIAPHREQFFRGIRIAAGIPDRPPHETEYLWMQYRHSKLFQSMLPPEGVELPQLQWLINRHFLGRVEDWENKTAALETRLGLAEETISEIQRLLPSSLTMVEENGELVIPAIFWQAIVQKMQTPDASPLWDHFLQTNHARIASAANEAAERHVNEYAEFHKLVSSETFQQAIVKSQSHMEEHFSERLRNFQAHVLTEARRVAADVVIPKVQLEALAHSNLLRNMDAQLKETNYFSIGLGALVNPYYTSCTYGKRTALQTILGTLSWASGFYVYHPPGNKNSPATALLEWSEGAQCWCAAHSKDEKALAQLGVQMPNKIHPETVVIEHVPPTGTRDIRSAPQHFEVWAQVGSAKDAERLKNALHMEIHHDDRHQCEKPPKGEKNWVCILSDVYNIHGPNYVQVYHLQSTVKDILTNKIVFRVTKNWGGDYTCLYRVRLTGSEDGLDEEYALHR